MDNVRETSTLIGANKVEGADVFNAGGDRVGSIHDLMIDKQSGQVAYAIMSFGGFLGVGTAIIRCHGRSCDTTRTWAAMWLASRRPISRTRRPIRLGSNRHGAIPNTRASSATTMASGRTAGHRASVTFVAGSAPSGQCAWWSGKAAAVQSAALSSTFAPRQRAGLRRHSGEAGDTMQSRSGDQFAGGGAKLGAPATFPPRAGVSAASDFSGPAATLSLKSAKQRRQTPRRRPRRENQRPKSSNRRIWAADPPQDAAPRVAARGLPLWR